MIARYNRSVNAKNYDCVLAAIIFPLLHNTSRGCSPKPGLFCPGLGRTALIRAPRAAPVVSHAVGAGEARV